MVEPSATAEMAKHAHGRLGDQMRDAAQSLMHEQKERVATFVDGLAGAFRHTAGTVDRDRQFGATRYADQAAVRIERISAAVRNHELSDTVASVQSLARRRPAWFVAGAVAAGFVMSRLLTRAPRDERPHEFRAARERL
jgi:hypothetical protein